MQAPLSCDMRMRLNEIVAKSRDIGMSRKRLEATMNKEEATMNKEDKLTKIEKKTIFDRVYIEGKNKSPDEIKDAVYKACKNGH